MARCPDCNKFVSLEPGDPDASSPDVTDGKLQLQVQLDLNCAECGTAIKSATYDFELEHPNLLTKCEADEEVSEGQHDWEFDVEFDEVDEIRDKRRVLMQLSGKITGTCMQCETEANVTFSGMIAKGDFEEA